MASNMYHSYLFKKLYSMGIPNPSSLSDLGSSWIHSWPCYICQLSGWDSSLSWDIHHSICRWYSPVGILPQL